MSRKKLIRFNANSAADNVLEPGKPLYKEIKGKWHSEYFKNNNPIVVELACGKGEYTTGLAAVYPDKNFIGVDVKGDRIWIGSTRAIEQNLANVAFLRAQIEHLEDFFEKGEISEIWIVHPDPRPRSKDEKRRLTSPRFMDVYRNIARKEAIIRLKTDNLGLFEYTLEVLKEQKIEDVEATDNLHQSELLGDHHGIRTRFEEKSLAKGLTIKYLKFKLI